MGGEERDRKPGAEDSELKKKGAEEESGRVLSGEQRTDREGALDATVMSDGAGTTPGDDSGAFDETVAIGSEKTREEPPRQLAAFGAYSRVEVLAEQGNMGLVARGLNDEFDRWELLKFLRPDLADNHDLLRQFKREGRALAKLAHPNVVQVFATYGACRSAVPRDGVLAGQVAFGPGPQCTPRGESWDPPHARSRTRSGRSARARPCCIATSKPDNLFVTEAGKGRSGGLKLIDFGLATVDRAKMATEKLDPSMASDAGGGTPLFMAPELWRGREATPRTDLYAIGVSFYYAFTKHYPFEEITVRGVQEYCASTESAPTCSERRGDLPAALVSIIDRLCHKDEHQRPLGASELVSALEEIEATSRPRKVPGSGPYRGLEPFTSAEREVFFGRDAEVAEIIDRLRNQPGIVLVGPSGSGKSSLAHAGAAPTIEDGALGGGLAFTTAAFEPHGHPIRGLARALASATGGSPEELAKFLRKEPERLAEALTDALPSSTGLVLIIDQLEEIATLSDRSEDSAAFAAAIGSLVSASHRAVRVIATLRADLMDRLFGYEPLRDLLTRGFYPVRPLTGDALKSALVEPAKAAGYSLENPEIADEIVEQVGRAGAGAAAHELRNGIVVETAGRASPHSPHRSVERARWPRGRTGAARRRSAREHEPRRSSEREADPRTVGHRRRHTPTDRARNPGRLVRHRRRWHAGARATSESQARCRVGG